MTSFVHPVFSELRRGVALPNVREVELRMEWVFAAARNPSDPVLDAPSGWRSVDSWLAGEGRFPRLQRVVLVVTAPDMTGMTAAMVDAWPLLSKSRMLHVVQRDE